MKKMLRLLGLLLVLPLARPASAYVTSAILEFSNDDYGDFYLNGRLITRSDFNWNDFQSVATSDGTLPLAYFNPNGDNVLAVRNKDTEGGSIFMGYRLTVHHSNGDPVVVWSEPGKTRLLHLRPREEAPQGWEQPGFDDSKWGLALEAHITSAAEYIRPACLEDPNFGIFGSMGCLPLASHMASARAGTGDHNLLRSHFAFPNTPAKVEVRLSSPAVNRGQKVRAQLLPGPDASYLNKFRLAAILPKGLKLAGTSAGGSYDPQRSVLTWDFESSASGVGYITLPASAVIQAPGWSQPQKVLGGPKAGKVRKRTNELDAVFNDGAAFPSGSAGWFRLQAPPPGSIPAGARFTGIIFRSQLRLDGKDTMEKVETAPVYFNYSVDGSTKGLLKKDVLVSRTGGDYYWVDGYHEASADRAWTWEDLNRLSVKYESRQRRLKKRNLIAGSWAVVRYYVPGKISPWFDAVVDDGGCRDVQLVAGLLQPGRPLVSSDPVRLALNPYGCPPTATPTPVPTATPRPIIVRAPTPEPTRAAPEPTPAGVQMAGGQIKLGCLQSAPEPFKRGGVYVSFCVQQAAHLTLAVYNSQTGKLVREMDAGDFLPGGTSQLYFNGLDDQGVPLLPGAYVYELRASANGISETRNAMFRRGQD